MKLTQDVNMTLLVCTLILSFHQCLGASMLPVLLLNPRPVDPNVILR